MSSNSTIKKVDRPKKFKTINLKPIDDDYKLSWKAKGLLIYLLSRPDGWSFYKTDIINRSDDGRTATQNGLEELRENGYLVISRKKDEKGRFSGADWWITDDPEQYPIPSRIQQEDPKTLDTGNPNSGEPRVRKTTNKQQKESKQNSNVNNIYNHWKEKSQTITHRKLTTPMKKAIKARLKDYSVDEIKTAIDNYNMVVASDDYFFSYNNWALNEFLSREEGKHVEKFLENPEGFKKDKEKSDEKNQKVHSRYKPDKVDLVARGLSEEEAEEKIKEWESRNG